MATRKTSVEIDEELLAEVQCALGTSRPDPSTIVEILDGIPGAFERHQRGREDARAGRVTPLEHL